MNHRAVAVKDSSLLILITASWAVLCGLYFLFGPRLIEGVFSGTLPFPFLNGIISSNTTLPLEHYQNYATSIVLTLIPLLYSLSVTVALLLRHWRKIVYSKHAKRECGSHLLSPLLLMVLVCIAWVNRFIQDDAFISFRYADNLVRGFGLTWNPGEPAVEGYTNFLWTILAAFFIRLGVSPVLFSTIAGLVLFAGSIMVFYNIARLTLNDCRLAVFGVLLLGTNHTFSSYATGGLETQLQSFLILSAAYLSFRAAEADKTLLRRYLYISLVAAAALLTRMDSVLFIAVLYAMLLHDLVFVRKSSDLAAYMNLLLPVIAVFSAYSVFRIAYYGDFFPNTFYVKATGSTNIIGGIRYVLGFLLRYGYLPLLLYGLFRQGKFSGLSRRWWVLSAMCTVWILYVIKVGGCFMEYRMMVPAFPLLLIPVLHCVFRPAGFLTRRVLLALLVSLSFVHSHTYDGDGHVESTRGLHNWIGAARWDRIGIALAHFFQDESPEVTIATTAAGAIPYYSGLRTIDMHGLNDLWIPRHGFSGGYDKPGHQLCAPTAYLMKQEVNIVIGHPHIRHVSEPRQALSYRAFIMDDLPSEELPPGTRILEIPIDDDYLLSVLYLVRSETVDRVILEKGFTELLAF